MFGYGIDIANIFIIDDNAVESIFFSLKKYDAPHLFSSTEFSKWCFVIIVRRPNSHNQLCSNRISKKMEDHCRIQFFLLVTHQLFFSSSFLLLLV